ncbi:topless-related protein 1-like [Pyrus ussuriensis x Pyrus communis]|uniref:Topless-related protein 1-like n=1 Tax=Pyrus ussuriensis x Pyrus communis TaxID=2448454 RepID=A0A5N5GKZ1_9ROSA|nr:topless-related protein 1-like [Pyrus ussuriensis x Pyrus communis]
MMSLSKELVFLILQFLDGEKFKETSLHRLEQESGVFFNMKYFEDEVHNGNWDEVEKYLSGFTKMEDNSCSMKIFFEIRKQKPDRSQAVDILVKDLNFFAAFDELLEEITQLSTLENFSKFVFAKLAAVVKDPGVSVNHVIRSPDGSYHRGDDVREHLEIDAHVGGVNDLAFSHPNEQLCVITCGDDKTIKVWDATTGAKQYTFEGQEAPVYSVCPHYKENIQFIFSIALDGKIKAWAYDNLGSRVDYDAPGRCCTTMAYSADGTRTYQGFRKRSFGVVQFNTTKNRFLAVGDDFSIKFWDMDNIQLLATADADGGLPASPRIRLNKDGTLLAASANENGIKVLANADGMRLL